MIGLMRPRIERDRLREFVDIVIDSLDEPAVGSELAARAFLSRFHFDRLVSAAMGESPTAFRRRLLLERAAWQLARGSTAVIDAAIAAGYDTADGFSRAFVRAFGIPPSRFHRQHVTVRIPAANGVHFHPPGGLTVPGATSGATTMDLTDRLFEHDLWHTRHLLEKARTLSGDALDATVWDDWESMPFDADEPTIRSMLSRLVTTKESWLAAIAGADAPDNEDTSLDSLARRLDTAGADLIERFRAVRDRDQWEDGFVDALCDPPKSFTYGNVAAHLVIFSAYRRQILLKALHHLGVPDLGNGGPGDWERAHE